MNKIYQGINFCFMYGQIISNINFSFFYNSKIHNSVVEFKIEINYEKSTRKLKKQTILVRAYDDIADKIYQLYDKGKIIKIFGKVTSEYVEIDGII